MSLETKQIIVVRSDLKTKNGQKLPKGKEDAQVAHAAMAFLTQRLKVNKRYPKELTSCRNQLCGAFTDEEIEWMRGSFRKVVLVAHDEEELLDVYKKAKEAGLEAHLITDSGYTCFDEPTNTCVGIGPHRDDKIDPITAHLKLR
jgi:peptidyl-tRNA hydrolase